MTVALETRIRKARRGEDGDQVELFDSETGLVVATHAAAGGDRRGEFAAAHEEFRADFDARDTRDKEHVRAEAAQQRQRFDADKRGDA